MKSFEERYKELMIQFKLAEGKLGGQTILGSTHWFWNRIPRLTPEPVGYLLEKPHEEDGKLVGMLRLAAPLKSVLWNFADAFTPEFGDIAEITVMVMKH